MTVRFRSADRLGPEHVGRRVTVRRRLPEGGSGDVLGTLEAIDADTLVVRRRDGEAVRVSVPDIVAARVVRARGV